MLKKTLVFLLASVIAMYPIFGSLAHAGSGEDVKIPLSPQGEDGLDKASKVKLHDSYGKLPLSFIQNNGQINEKVKFYEKGSGHATFFTDQGVYLSLRKGSDTNAKVSVGSLSRKASLSERLPHLTARNDNNPQSENIKLIPLNANKNPKIIAEDKMEGKVNYFIGNDSNKWKTNVPTYGAVVYKEIYKGIDMKFYGNNRELEYDIIVKPGADPNKVQLSYEGIEGLRITDDGNLEIDLKQGKLIQKRPYIYQEINGKRVEVEGRFNIFHSTPATDHAPLFSYGFQVASYNKNHSLIIDPVIVYSTYLGGSSLDYGYGIAVDSYGNAYVVGDTSSIDFPLASPYQGACGGSVGCQDIFITKFNAAGTGLVYSTYLGGSGGEYFMYGGGTFPSDFMTIDKYGNVYVTGYTGSTDFPLKSPIYTSGPAFVTKINASGSSLVYSTYLPGDGIGGDIAVDGSGNAYITGSAGGSYPSTSTNPVLQYHGSSDAFVTKINAAGTGIVYYVYIGSSTLDLANGIAVDGSGNAYITGETNSRDFPTTSNAFKKSIADNGDPDAFVTKINSKGTSIVYSTLIGGDNSQEGAMAIAVDSKGNAYITGWTSTAQGVLSDFPTAPSNPIQKTAGQWCNAFVTKLNSTGSGLVYSTFLGGDGDDDGIHIAVDKSGNAYVTGTASSANFPLVNPVDNTCGPSVDGVQCLTHDAFVSKINATGTALVYSTYLGGDSSYERGNGIAVDGAGNAYVTGETLSTDFPLVSPYRGYFSGGLDAFVTKISP